MAKKATEAHNPHTKKAPYSWSWDLPYDPNQFGDIQFPFDIEFILDRAEAQLGSTQDSPDKRGFLQCVRDARVALAEGNAREAAKAAYIAGQLGERLGITPDAASGRAARDARETLHFKQRQSWTKYQETLDQVRLDEPGLLKTEAKKEAARRCGVTYETIHRHVRWE